MDRTNQPLHISNLISAAMFSFNNAQEGDPVRSTERVPYSSSPVFIHSGLRQAQTSESGNNMEAGFHRIANANESGLPSGDALDNHAAA